MNRKQENWLILGLIMVACCMRSPISGIGPLVSQIATSLNLNEGISGILTTIPLVVFALCAPIVGKLSLMVNHKTQIFVCVFLVGLGILVRSYFALRGLFLGTILLGLGIGALNVIMPLFIKSNFPNRIGLVMGCYAATMTSLSAIASGTVILLSTALGTWNHALSVFALIPIITLPVWFVVSKSTGESNSSSWDNMPKTSVWNRSNCNIAIFMGLQSCLFFSMITWLPSILTICVGSTSKSALMMLVLQLFSLITNFMIPIAVQRANVKQRSLLGVLCGTVNVMGFLVILLALQHPIFTWGGIVLLGLSSGMGLSYTLTLISLKAGSPRDTASLSSFVQTVGYLVAATGPLTIGLLANQTGSFFVPLLALIGISILLACFGARAGASHIQIQQ